MEESLVKFITPRFVSYAMLIWFALVMVFFAVITVILNYHWKQYGVTVESLKRLRKIYFSVSGVIMAAMTVILIYSFR